MQVKIHSSPETVVARLAQLGLVESDLRDPVHQGMLVLAECTPNDPPLIPGITAWGRVVRTLREGLIPKGWARSDEGNYSLVINPHGTMAIATATGDEHTGDPFANAATKSSKGPRTQSAIEVNSQQLILFPDLEPLPTYDVGRATWILLQHFDNLRKEVRIELSLPISYGGRVDGWAERIILEALPFDTTTNINIPMLPDLPDIEVPLRRRA